jgi:hypothetical protein
MILLSELAEKYGEEVVREYALDNWDTVAEYKYGSDWVKDSPSFQRPLDCYRVPESAVRALDDYFNRIGTKLETRNIEARLQWLEAQHQKDQRMIMVQRQMLGLMVQP